MVEEVLNGLEKSKKRKSFTLGDDEVPKQLKPAPEKNSTEGEQVKKKKKKDVNPKEKGESEQKEITESKPKKIKKGGK